MYKRLFIFLVAFIFIYGCKKEPEYELPEEEVEYEEEEEEEYEFPILDEDGYLEGVLEIDGDYTVKGRYKGTIIATGTIVVEETGIVECDSIVAENVIIKGHVTGDVKAIYKIELHPTGIHNGLVFCKSLVVDGESIFDGRSKMGGYKIRRRAR